MSSRCPSRIIQRVRLTISKNEFTMRPRSLQAWSEERFAGLCRRSAAKSVKAGHFVYRDVQDLSERNSNNPIAVITKSAADSEHILGKTQIWEKQS
jgi:hypothetical protein